MDTNSGSACPRAQNGWLSVHFSSKIVLTTYIQHSKYIRDANHSVKYPIYEDNLKEINEFQTTAFININCRTTSTSIVPFSAF